MNYEISVFILVIYLNPSPLFSFSQFIQICTQQLDSFNVVTPVNLLINGMGSIVTGTHWQQQHRFLQTLLKR